jgi:DNA-binding NtrC family response regulator
MLELARSHRHHYDAVDLVISDIRMPKCSGIQAVEIIRSIRPRVRFLLVTAFPDDETRRRAAALGVVLLEKPFSISRLVASVEAALVATRPK